LLVIRFNVPFALDDLVVEVGSSCVGVEEKPSGDLPMHLLTQSFAGIRSGIRTTPWYLDDEES
jgi:hypothetical protein